LENEEFKEKFGSLFCEFKCNKGFWSSLFYTVFFVRRFAFVLTQFFLNSVPLLQALLNILFTLLQMIYMFVYFPFRDKLVFISEIVGEICTLIVFVATAFLLKENTEHEETILEDVAIYTILVTIGFQLLVSFYCFMLRFIELYQKLKKRKASKVKIVPIDAEIKFS
jgi:hypothetical protein